MDPRRAALVWILLVKRRRRHRQALRANPKLKNTEAVFMTKSDREFKLLFRLSRELFMELVEGIRSNVEFYRFSIAFL
jgi:hypothetical protein